MKSEDVLFRLVKTYGIRRALVLLGAAMVAAHEGWDALIGDEAYTRQGVWTWKRDLEKAGIDVFTVKWEGMEKNLGTGIGQGLKRATVRRREKAAAAAAKAARPRRSA